MGADTIRRHGWMKDNKIVKWYLVFSHFLPGCVLPFTSLAGCNLVSVFALVSITFCLLGFSYISAHRATIDLSPNFVGAVSGLMQAPVTVSGKISLLYAAASYIKIYDFQQLQLRSLTTSSGVRIDNRTSSQ